MFIDLSFSNAQLEDRFCDYLVSRRVLNKWFDCVRLLAAVAGLIRYCRIPLPSTAYIFLISVPANAVDSYLSLTCRWSWRSRAMFAWLASTINVFSSSYFYTVIFPEPASMNPLQMLLFTAAGSFWGYIHMVRYAPLLPFREAFLHLTLASLVFTARAPAICSSSKSLQWSADKVGSIIIKLFSLLGLDKFVMLDAASMCILQQTILLMIPGYAWSLYLAYASERRLRIKYVRETVSDGTVVKDELDTIPTDFDFSRHFLLCGVVFLLGYSVGVF